MFTRTIPFRLFSVRNITVHIDASTHVDFEKIDPRIKHISPWVERYPMSTKLHIPNDNLKELKEKLMGYPGITSVDGLPTQHGEEIQKKLRDDSPYFHLKNTHLE